VASVLVFVEHDGEGPLETSLQALAFARGVAGALAVPMHAAVLGSTASAIAQGLVAHGVAVAHVAADERLDDVAPDAWASALAQIAEASGAGVVLASGTERGNEVLARLGARLDQPMAAVPLQVFTYAISPYEDWHDKAWAGALVLITMVLLINIAARVLTREKR